MKEECVEELKKMLKFQSKRIDILEVKLVELQNQIEQIHYLDSRGG